VAGWSTLFSESRLTPELQVRWHDHADFDDGDWDDMSALAERFGLTSPGERPGLVSPRRNGVLAGDGAGAAEATPAPYETV